jgi:phage-related protein
MNKRGYRRLETSDDPNHYWMARVENSPQIAMRLRTLAPFEVGFDCKPQRFLKSGENAVSFSRNGRIENVYGQNARPLITVYGNGNGSLTIGKYTVSIESIGGSIYLDSETQNAYNNYENQNANINAPEFPVIEPGDNVVSFQGGITSVEIVPRWWEV